MLQRFRENWVRPALFFGNNPISLAGGAITTASGVTMIAYWIVELFGRPDDNPYLGIIFFLILPALFILGLVVDSDRRVFAAAGSCGRQAKFQPSFPRSISTIASSVTASTSFSSPQS